MDVHIYGLIDPREKNICYVGQTKFLAKRYYMHCERPDHGGNKLKAAWIKELRREKRKPLLYIFETTCEKLAYEREAFWMVKTEELGFSLLNKQVYRMLGIGCRKFQKKSSPKRVPRRAYQPIHQLSPMPLTNTETIPVKQKPESLFKQIRGIIMKSFWTHEIKEHPCEQDLISRYDEKQERLAHKASLAEKYKLVGHPKLDMIYAKSWELGHTQGLTEVEFYFSEFAEVLR